MALIREETGGECLCGCGERTPLGRDGRPLRYVGAHYNRGRRPPNYRGAPKAHSDGYVLVAAPGHPRAHLGYAYEHVLVAERALGHALPPGAQVHHVNENPADNRPSNLVICQDNAYHALLHCRARALAACGNPDGRKCTYCGAWDDPGAMTVLRTRPQVAYHTACAAEHFRRKRREARATA